MAKALTPLNFRCPKAGCLADAGLPCFNVPRGKTYHQSRINVMLRDQATAKGKKKKPAR